MFLSSAAPALISPNSSSEFISAPTAFVLKLARIGTVCVEPTMAGCNSYSRNYFNRRAVEYAEFAGLSMPYTPFAEVEILPPLPTLAEELSQLDWLVDLMDSRFHIPGTKYRVGLDALLGLIPGIGKGLGAVVSFYILLRLWQHDLPWYLRARLVGNIMVDFTLGTLPVVGDLFDIGFKANRRNVGLVRKHLVGKPKT
jgi:hypothetical protein